MPKSEKEEKEFQAKYIQLQLMRQQANAYIEEKKLITERVNELNTTIDALHRLDDVKKGDEIWSSLGSGAFARSDIKDTEKVMVAIGASVVVRETRERAIEILQSRLEEMSKLENEIVSEINKLAEAINSVESELENMAKE